MARIRYSSALYRLFSVLCALVWLMYFGSAPLLMPGPLGCTSFSPLRLKKIPMCTSPCYQSLASCLLPLASCLWFGSLFGLLNRVVW
ncbi:hypothetical protein KPSA3_06475 [Pseudomonas syringae pv. actinidiae]|uniref:Uncharacterized protein n=1 Tax=Pseudomonas syringae pv. actinidiae TaxID=103796 RepID=A0AAN4TNX5_PSESF|nr:hypothetical protein KPSA3_06475 [Pseudomonas syringae pv. actinidiae]